MTTTPGMSSDHLSIAEHPDIQKLSHRHASEGARSAAGLSALAVLTGMYAAISPWVVGFHAQSAFAVNDLIVGLAIAYLASMVVRESSGLLTGVSGLMGVWLVISPFIVQNTHRTAGLVTSNVVTGAVVVVLSLAAFGALALTGRNRMPR